MDENIRSRVSLPKRIKNLSLRAILFEDNGRRTASESPSYSVSTHSEPFPFSSTMSAPGTPRRVHSVINPTRRKQHSIGSGSSPLHIAALFASATKAAIGTTNSRILRDDSISRLFTNADDVFKAWEENTRIREAEEAKKNQSPGSGIRKMPSMGAGDIIPRRRRTTIVHRAKSIDMETAVQQHVVQFPSEISASNFVLNKISTCSDTAIHIVDSPHRKRAPSLQKISVSSNIKRRFSGALSINDSGSVKKVSLENDFVIHEQIGTGRFGKIYSAEHRQSGSKITLKFFPLPQTKLPDFIREYNFSRFVAPHPNAIDTFEGVFKTDDESSFFFVQEFCPYGSLKDLVEKTIAPGSIPGIGEKLTKMILSKVLCAVEFMHGEGLVHRNLTAANVLIFDADQFTKIKIADFGLTRYSDSNVKHLECINSYHSAELCEAVLNETITLCRAIDIWSLGIMVAYCLKAKFPWQKASIMCKPYWEWDEYLRHKTPQLPKYFEAFDEKAVKLFKHCLNPKPKDRWSIKDLKKFIEKEQLEKSKIPVDELMYYPEDDSKCSAELKQQRKSAISQWINTVSNTVSEISDQVVSARDDGLC